MKRIMMLFSTLFPLGASAQECNYHFSHTDSTTAPPASIWQVWTDVPNWHKWDTGLKKATLQGAFELGAKGKLVPDKGPKASFIISDLTSDSSYTFKTRIPLGWLVIKRSLNIENGVTYFTHEVMFTGPLKKVFGAKLGENYRAMLPGVLAEVKKRALSEL